MAGQAGFEPTNDGVKVRCLSLLATAQYSICYLLHYLLLFSIHDIGWLIVDMTDVVRFVEYPPRFVLLVFCY